MAAKPPTAAGEDDRLLPEIWVAIFSRLPVMSIFRCKSVCRSWCSLISCPNFISNYSSTNLNQEGNRVLLQLYDSRGNAWSFTSFDESFLDSREHNDFPELLRDHVRIVGSCNGLICLSKFVPGRYWEDANNASVVRFVIWNPAIRKIVELPPRTFCPLTQYASYCGFGFDSKTSDYKVVCILGNSADLGGRSKLSEEVANVSDVFDLGKGVWRRINPLVQPWNVGRPHPECYLHEAVHWTGYRRVNSSDKILLSFNIGDECFLEMRMPDCAEFTHSVESCVKTKSVALGGLIYMFVWRIGEDEDEVFDLAQSCSIWVMKEYGVTESWTKVSDIDLRTAQALPSTCLWPYHFQLREDGGVLMVRDLHVDDNEDVRRKQDLVLYNTESRKCKRLFSITKHISDICFYNESLFLM